MALNTANNRNNGNNKNRVEQPVIEPDVYPSYVAQVIDMGLQAQKPYQGKEKPPVQEVMLTYELSECYMVDENGEEQEDKPRWVSETLPLYGLFADKAKSTKRYMALDPTEEFKGDFSKLAGLPCNVTIVNNVVGEKTYTNVGNVASISAKKAEKMPPMKNPVKVFDLDEPDMEVFNALPEWIREKIKGNLNFKGSPLEAALAGGKPADKPKQQLNVEKGPKAKPAPEPEEEFEDNPF